MQSCAGLHLLPLPKRGEETSEGEKKMDFKDKVAIVTGGTKGSGRAILSLLAEQGCRVFMIYSRDNEAAQAVVKAAEKFSGAIMPVQADVTDPAPADRMVDGVAEE